MKDCRFNDIYDAIEDELLMKDWMKGNYDELLTTDSVYESYKFLDDDLYCDECNVYETEKYLKMKGNK